MNYINQNVTNHSKFKIIFTIRMKNNFNFNTQLTNQLPIHNVYMVFVHT